MSLGECSLSTGASVEFEGKLIQSVGAKQKIELAASNVTIIGDSPPDVCALCALLLSFHSFFLSFFSF
jgi:aspartyl/asparaginyl-tRNA synthetase